MDASPCGRGRRGHVAMRARQRGGGRSQRGQQRAAGEFRGRALCAAASGPALRRTEAAWQRGGGTRCSRGSREAAG
eukprot:4270036-Prymnesium_polylepis.1